LQKKTCIPYDVSRTYSRGNKMEKFEIIEKLENEWHHIVNEASKMSPTGYKKCNDWIFWISG
jgi:hypothetical protein